MDDKSKARLMRELADTEDRAAGLCTALGWLGLGTLHQSSAEFHRLQADKSDPPQPEWKEGDLVVDRNDDLWKCLGNDVWFRFLDRHGIVWLTTGKLLKDVGPLRKVNKVAPVDEHSE